MAEFTYMNYMTEAERASFIAEKALNDEFEKLNILFEMCNLQQRIHNIEVENKVLTENGSYDDYAILLLEANSQVSQEKEGILAKIFEWFAKVFDSIHKAIAGIFSKKPDPNQMVNAPAVFFDQKFGPMIDNIINVLNNDIVKMFASAAIGALAKTFGDKIANKVDELIKWFGDTLKAGGVKLVASTVAQGVTNKLQGLSSTVMDLINKIKTKKPADDQEATAEQGMLKKLGELMSNVVNKGITTLSGVFGKADNQQPAQQQQAAPQQNPAPTQPAQQPAPQAQPAQAAPAGNPAPAAAPVNASAETEPLADNELSMYESVFGKLDEEKKDDDISDLLSLI